MKCPKCSADSTVLSTRVFKKVLLRRARECFNEHRFSTFEVFAGNLDRRQLDKAAAGIAMRKIAWTRKQTVAKNPKASTTALANLLDITEARVRQIRRELHDQHE